MKRLPLIALALFLLTLALLVIARGSPGMLYVLTFWADGDFYLAAPDGSSTRYLTTSASIAPEAPMVWSPDGRWIAFTRFDEIYKIRPNRGAQQRLTRQPGSISPVWSPDGSTLFYWNFTNGNIYRMAADGSQAQPLTDRSSYESAATLSPNGEWLAFAATPNLGEPLRVYLMHPDGSDLRPLTGEGFNPRWLPDSEGLIFHTDRDDTTPNNQAQFTLYQVDLASGAERPITTLANPIRSADWAISPDGQQIAFQGQDSRLYTVWLRDGQVTPLTDFPAFRPAWSPDSEWLVVVETTSSRLYRVRRDGRDLEALRTRFRFASDPAFSPRLD